MAGDWIKRTKGLQNKREVIAMASALKLTGNFEYDRRIVAECCCEVWDWADSESRDGHVPCVTKTFLDALVSVPGFADLMEAQGWLAVEGDGLRFPNFERHNGKSAKVRSLASSRKQQQRGRVTQMSRADRDKNATREEKRREEIKDITDKPKARPADPVWDAVCDVFALDPATKAEKSRVGGIVRDIKLKIGGNEPMGAIQGRVASHRRKWPNISPVTPESVMKHWDQLAPSTPTPSTYKLGIANAG